jgi:hypothetical protein
MLYVGRWLLVPGTVVGVIQDTRYDTRYKICMMYDLYDVSYDV